MVVSSSANSADKRLLICVFTTTESVAQILQDYLDKQCYELCLYRSQSDFLAAIQREYQRIDCLILYEEVALLTIVSYLQERRLLFPTLILQPPREASAVGMSPLRYHAAEIYLSSSAADQFSDGIDQAIKAFLELSPASAVEAVRQTPHPSMTASSNASAQKVVRQQQRRLANKLNERLGYLGVYYKRDPAGFARSLPPAERAQFLKELKASYRDIIVTYFLDDPTNNDKLDAFVNTVFFADLSVAKVVEIHMDLIDQFSKQLKLEGRSEEVLLDYRLTLIDTLAHLAEMYRRSIPREIPENQ